jgi:hypothetical protein
MNTNHEQTKNNNHEDRKSTKKLFGWININPEDPGARRRFEGSSKKNFVFFVPSWLGCF